MSLKQKAFKGIVWSSFQQFSTQVISFVVSVILARILSPGEFGLIAMIGVFISLGNSLVESGLSQSLLRTKNPDEEDYSTVFFFNLIISLFVYVLIFIFSNQIAIFFNQPILTRIIRVYGIIFIINALSIIQTTRLTYNFDFKTQMKIALPSLIFGSSLGILLAYNGFGVWSLVWSAIAQSAVSCVYLWKSSSWRPVLSLNLEKIKHHLGFGYKLTISGIIDTIFVNSYAIIIGKYFAPAQVGFYQRADSLKQLPVSNFIYVLNKVTFPLFAQIHEDDVRLKNAYRKIIKIVVFLVAPTLIFMAVLATPLFRFLFTEKWLPSVPFFQILCINGILYPIHAFNLSILNVKGNSGLFLKVEIVKKVLLTVVLLISFNWGIYGLIYGSVVFSIIAFFINTHFTFRYLKYSAWQQIKDLFPSIFLALVCGLLIFLIDNQLKVHLVNDLIRIVLPGSIGLLIYVTISYILSYGQLNDLKSLVKKDTLKG